MPTKASTEPESDIWKDASTSDRWLVIVVKALIHFHGPATLHQLYELIERHPKTQGRKHWKAKIRQTLELSKGFVRVAPATWDFASEHSAKAQKKFEHERRERYPRRTQAKS